jgi:hypothetical protein
MQLVNCGPAGTFAAAHWAEARVIWSPVRLWMVSTFGGKVRSVKVEVSWPAA